MLIWQRTASGTIREENQDQLVVREDEGVLLIADGRGSAGREQAQIVAAELERGLVMLPRYGRVDEAADRLRGLFVAAEQALQARQVRQPGLVSSGVDVAVAVLVEGQLLMASSGTGGILAMVHGELYGVKPQGLPSLGDLIRHDGKEPRQEGQSQPETKSKSKPKSKSKSKPKPKPKPESESETRSEFETSRTRAPLGDPVIQGPIPLTVGDWVMLFSEGLLVSQPIEEVARIAFRVLEEPEETAEALFQLASARYDGDDRSMVLARFLPRDLKRRFPPDTVVSVDLDRHLTMPLWKPLAIVGGAFMAVFSLFLILWRKFR